MVGGGTIEGMGEADSRDEEDNRHKKIKRVVLILYRVTASSLQRPSKAKPW